MELCVGCGIDRGSVIRHLEEEAPLPPIDWLYNYEEEE